ncbi:MAG TPA: hypothetical protein VG077_19780, partial [Verrucomicrobiae bacterium]|nr:hypothetical protein [Verrucomicrobiae bacterium]
SNDRVNIGAGKETKPCFVWKRSGAMIAGTCFSHTIAELPRPKTEMRPTRKPLVNLPSPSAPAMAA